ncbi:hypothetical protein JTB14_037649 [Gonioctena quinquepunctata]|nr:hypothetical protein JTB14_037649 [Gonioctena quinquepunctata]
MMFFSIMLILRKNAAKDVVLYSITSVAIGLSISLLLQMITRGNKDAVIPFITSSLLTSTIISGAVALGQELINESNKLREALYGCLWYNWNSKNRKSLMFLLLVTEKPSQIELTETVVLNHDLAVKILKGIYTFAAVVFNM